MDGNPHYADYQLDLDNAADYDAPMMQLHATLALAWEQRTANLIALHAIGITDMSGWHESHMAEWFADRKGIAERLGMEQ